MSSVEIHTMFGRTGAGAATPRLVAGPRPDATAIRTNARDIRALRIFMLVALFILSCLLEHDLAAGSWKPAAGSRKLAAGSFQLKRPSIVLRTAELLCRDQREQSASVRQSRYSLLALAPQPRPGPARRNRS